MASKGIFEQLTTDHREVDDLMNRIEKAQDERSPEEVGLVFGAIEADTRIKADRLVAALGPEETARRRELRARLDRLEADEPPPLPRARVLAESSPEAGPTHLLIRGQYGRNGPEVQPGFPAVLAAEGPDPIIRPTAHSTKRLGA